MMCILWRVYYLILLALLSSTTSVVAKDVSSRGNQTARGKESIATGLGQNSFLPLVEVQPENSKCLDDCFRRNQMVSVGFEIIKQQCRLEETFVLLNSPQKEDYTKGVKTLSELDTPQAVQPLSLLR
jgi:hypothetical protein